MAELEIHITGDGYQGLLRIQDGEVIGIHPAGKGTAAVLVAADGGIGVDAPILIAGGSAAQDVALTP